MAVLGPVSEDTEQVTQVSLGVEPVQLARGHEGEEVGSGLGVVVAADEEPCLPADGRSRLILPMSHFEQWCIIGGIPRTDASWKCNTAKYGAVRLSSSA